MNDRQRLAREVAGMTVSYFAACLRHLACAEVNGELGEVYIGAELHHMARRYGCAWGFECVQRDGRVRARLSYDLPEAW